MSPEPRLRLFVALLPSEPARAALAELGERMPRARWVPVEQMHLTMRFVGEVTEEQAAKIEDALARVSVAAFPLGVEGVGRFPPRGGPNAIWAGVGGGHPFLHRLRQQVDDQLLRTGVPFELTPFVPHITVARVREAPPVQVEHWLKKHRGFEGPVWRVEAFHLMESQLGPEGPEHRVRRSYALESVSFPAADRIERGRA